MQPLWLLSYIDNRWTILKHTNFNEYLPSTMCSVVFALEQLNDAKANRHNPMPAFWLNSNKNSSQLLLLFWTWHIMRNAWAVRLLMVGKPLTCSNLFERLSWCVVDVCMCVWMHSNSLVYAVRYSNSCIQDSYSCIFFVDFQWILFLTRVKTNMLIVEKRWIIYMKITQ